MSLCSQKCYEYSIDESGQDVTEIAKKKKQVEENQIRCKPVTAE
jgi:hypothetical protein